MKRIVSLVLALSMVLGLCATSFAAVNLEDITGTKYEAAVEALIELDVVSGYPDGTYRPEKEVNRAELAKLIVICMGLEEDAERAQGDNVFTDESLKNNEAYAWARGYVNTAAAAGVIKGYPTGEFKPEKTVTYAEALTMMLRALGYGNVMEEEGTWPTNAILKARELELTEDVEYKNSSDGAVRGDVAILLWNMLRTPMWKITSENQGTGMTSESDKIMLNVKFPDYAYAEVYFSAFDIVSGDEMGEVEVELLDDEYESLGWYTYLANDFYTFVEGTKVEVLVNTDDEEILTMVATGEDKLVEGKGYDLAEDYGVESDYAYLRVKGRKTILGASEYTIDSEYVEKLRGGAEKDEYITINSTRYEDDDDEDRVVIVDGERGTMKDVELGDIVTKVTLVEAADAQATNEDENALEFYIVESAETTGTLTRYVIDEGTGVLTVDGEEYVLDAKPRCIVDVEDEDSKPMDFTGAKAKDLYEDFKNEEVRLLSDVFGFVVRLEFGELEEEEEVTYGFYRLVSYDKASDSVTLENENGESEHALNLEEDDPAAAQMATALATQSSILRNCLVFAEFNADDEVKTLALVADKVDTDKDEETERYDSYIVNTGVYGEYEENDVDYDKFEVEEVLAANYDDKLEALLDADEKPFAYFGEVVIVKLLTKTNESTNRTTFTCEFVTDKDELKSLNGNEEDVAYIVVDKEDSKDNETKEVEYILILDDKSSSDLTFGKVAEVEGTNELDRDEVLVELEDGSEVEYKSKVTIDPETIAFLAFEAKENDKGELELTVLGNMIRKDHLKINTENHGYISGVNSTKGTVTATNIPLFAEGSLEVKLTAEGIKKALEKDVDDYKFVVINVVEDTAKDAIDGQYEVSGFETVEFDGLSLEKADRISIDDDAKAVFVIRGMEEKCVCDAQADEDADTYCDECDGLILGQ